MEKSKSKLILYLVKDEKTLITPEELREIYKKLKSDLDKKYNGEYKIMVRALNAIQYFTLKAYSDDDLIVDDEVDYFNNRVKDSKAKKFTNFSQISFTVIRNKTKEELKYDKKN